MFCYLTFMLTAELFPVTCNDFQPINAVIDQRRELPRSRVRVFHFIEKWSQYITWPPVGCDSVDDSGDFMLVRMKG
jgi:hypothetical protein